MVLRHSLNDNSSVVSRDTVRSLKETYDNHRAIQESHNLGEVLLTDDPMRIKVAQMIHCGAFKAFMGFCVFVSIGIVIHETDQKASDEEIPAWMSIVLMMLLGVYVVELVLRLYVSGHKFFRVALNVVDLTLVLVELVTMAFERFMPTLPNVMVIRFFRLIRIARLSAVMMRFRPLYMILQGFFSAMQAIFFATFLIYIVLSLWSIVAVEFVHPVVKELDAAGEFADCPRCSHAYSSVIQANLTFLQTIVVGDSWSVYVMPVIERDWRCAIIFAGAFITVQVGMLNLILSVIVDSAAQARADDEQRMIYEKNRAFEKAKVRFNKLCSELDYDASGTLTENELYEGLNNNSEFSQLLTAMDITEAELNVLFKMMDVEKTGAVSYEHFTEIMHRFKNDDLRTAIMFLKHYVLEITSKLDAELGSTLRRTEVHCARRRAYGSYYSVASAQSAKEDHSQAGVQHYNCQAFVIADDNTSRCGSSSNSLSGLSSADIRVPSKRSAARAAGPDLCMSDSEQRVPEEKSRRRMSSKTTSTYCTGERCASPCTAEPTAAAPQHKEARQESGMLTEASKELDAAMSKSRSIFSNDLKLPSKDSHALYEPYNAQTRLGLPKAAEEKSVAGGTAAVTVEKTLSQPDQVKRVGVGEIQASWSL